MEALYVLGGVVLGGIIAKIITHMMGKSVSQTADAIKQSAEKEADNIIKSAEISSKEKLLQMRDSFEEECKERRTELQQMEKFLNEKEANSERKMDLVQNRLDDISRRDATLLEKERQIAAQQDQYEQQLHEIRVTLQNISGISEEEAKNNLLEQLKVELTNERGVMIRQFTDEVRKHCERDAQKLMVQAMQRYSGECTYERTTSIVPLSSDELKGRIIGREGRNIRSFEAETGVNVLIDDTPQAVVITCFDPVRRETARLALERLVEDGRIHPTRIEEVVAKCKQEIDEEMFKAGDDAIHEMQIVGIPETVIKALGRLKFRYSYTQNVLRHSIEVSRFMAMIAAELNMDVDKAKQMGLFHDIGKGMDHDVEGTHAIIGMEFLKRAGIDKEVLNGVGCHHDEIPAETALAGLVSVCDALSASRPGARSETTEIYLKRLEHLEEIGMRFEGIESCYAVQAGREIRVLVNPDSVNQNQAAVLSRDIAKQIEEEMQYPGQIKVSVIRETRAVEYAS